MKILYIFDLDNTLVEQLNIDYESLRNELRMITKNKNENFKPLVNTMLKYNIDLELLDKYELLSVPSSNLKSEISNKYIEYIQKGFSVIILTRNSLVLVNSLIEFHKIPFPSKIIHRDTNINYQKPDIKVVESIDFSKYDKITYYGDSWHDEQLCENINKNIDIKIEFIKV
uniref:FCP1 homology domain-containing protein n=1 Tax=viral metagenome TaxID=1070528 RepID=A0A6C0AWM9_9ZZZZ|tara:strand:+ start:11724 stop:12236 length:513 start_codon:yes stop_codon:yes gene_type:complete